MTGNRKTVRRAAALLVAAFFCLLLQACATKAPPNNPWESPDRGFRASPQEEAELADFLQPCIEHARSSFSDAIQRFQAGLPQGTSFYVVARNDNQRNFYVRVNAMEGQQILGRIVNISSTPVKGRRYKPGDNYSLGVADIVDWLIVYPDRPEEGNLIGKYFLLRQDALTSGACNPQQIEAEHYRVFRGSYSFVPPVGKTWSMRGPYLTSDVSLQTPGAGPNELNTIYVERFKAPLFASDQELINWVRTAEKKNLGDPKRYTLIEHKVNAYTGKATRCVQSHQVTEDKKALLSKSGERGPMMRETMALSCVHPLKSDSIVVLTFAHRYQRGYRDAAFESMAAGVFKSLAFSVQNLVSE